MVPTAPPTRPLHWFQAALVGLPLVLLGLVVLSGSLQDALNLILFSTLCTLGIGGLFWLGLAALIGTALLAVVAALRQQPITFAGRAAAQQQLLAGYVQTRRRSGADEQRIRSDLQRAGWRAAEIENAFAAASSPGAQSGGSR